MPWETRGILGDRRGTSVDPRRERILRAALGILPVDPRGIPGDTCTIPGITRASLEDPWGSLGGSQGKQRARDSDHDVSSKCIMHIYIYIYMYIIYTYMKVYILF